VDLRVSCLPTRYGESVVLRVLDRSVVNLQLDALGIGEDVLAAMREIIHLPNGILLVTGPTGSGKTTTLYSALGEINNPEDKLLTAEDPVEYDIEGIMQCPINDAVGMTFQKALRAFLRQDPDRILVGEIRDFETAQIAIEASLTGHFVFSTLHTNDAASTVTRLVDMGVEPFLVASSLAGVLGQRLIRRVCKNCKTYYTPTDEDLDRLSLERIQVEGIQFCYGKGCPVCNNTGYKGRKALTELLVVNQELREMISDGVPANVLRDKAIEYGMRPLREDGLLAIFNGETTVDEVVRYT
jgi:type IV pilus assembly protein PilB